MVELRLPDDRRALGKVRRHLARRRLGWERNRHGVSGGALHARSSRGRCGNGAQPHSRTPLKQHLHDWKASLLAKSNTVAHAALIVSRAQKVVDGCKFVRWPDISASKVQNYIGERRTAGLSVQTCNSYLQAAKQFCKRCVRGARAPDSPLSHLQGSNVRVDRRHDRLASEVDELKRLIDVARKGPTRFKMSGVERAVLYILAVETGLRSRELRLLAWNSFDLGGNRLLLLSERRMRKTVVLALFR